MARKVKGAPEILNLPMDRPRGAVQTYEGSCHYLSIPKSLTIKLKEIANNQNATLYMVLLSAFNTLLYRYTGQQDILIGTPVSGRSKLETESLIGFL